MEQHKILLIIVSVCLFFAAVIGLGLWLFYPRQANGTPVAANGMQQGSTTFDPIEYLRQGQTQAGQQQGSQGSSVTAPAAGGQSSASGGQSPSTGGAGPAAGGNSSAGGSNGGTGTSQSERSGDVIIVYGQQPNSQQPTGSNGGLSSPSQSGSTSSTAAAPVATSRVGSAGANPAGPSVSQLAASRQSSKASTTANPASTSGQSSSPPSGSSSTRPGAVMATRQAATREAAKSVDQYWIQLIASTHRDTVEAADKVLQDHNLNGHISTVNIGDVDYFRLRVGPYESKAEAEKFLGWIKGINEFQNSFISQVAEN